MLLFSVLSLWVALALAIDAPECLILPTDATWPSDSVWHAFNASIDGRLIKTVPVGFPCHDPEFDEESCAVVRKNWRVPDFQCVLNYILWFAVAYVPSTVKPALPL